MRMLKAAELLTTTNLKVYAICERVGIGDQRYFSQVFRRTFGHTPMEYQKGKDRNDRVIYWSCHSLPHSNFGRAVFSSMILLWFQFSCISCNHLFSTSLTGLVKDLFLVFKRFTNPLWVLHPAHHNKFFSWIMWQWHLFLAGILINTGIRGGPGNRLYKMDFRIGLISIIVENISNLSLRGNSTLAM